MTTANKITIVRILMIPVFVTLAIYYGQSIQRGDTAKKAHELSSLAQRVEGSIRDLTTLRALLAELRRHAEDVRIAAAS